MQASKLGLSTRRGQLSEIENGNMIANDEIMVTSGKNDGNCLSSSVTTIENSNTNSNSSNKNEQQEHPHQPNKPTLGATSAPNNTSRSQVSSDNENSSDHSATWSTSNQSASKRSAQKRLEAAQKLNLILPQQQQQQLLHLQPQQKNCLSTPIVITSDDLHLVPSQHQQHQQQQAYGQFYQSQQMLFDSLAHQLNNQGGDVSLFTGLPSCTPASADRLTASGINPFFLQAAAAPTINNNYPANGELAPNGDTQMRHSWPDQNNAAQQIQDQGGAVNKHSLPSNGYPANNLSNSSNNNNNQHHLDQRTKLTIADLQAASALSPIILSPLSFLGLSPEQEALLRYGYVSPSQHPLSGRAFTQADLNQLNHQHQVYHLNQMYHGQRAEPINTHHYTLDHHHQQQQQMNQHHHQHHQQTLQHPHQQHNQQAFEHQQQQQHNQVAKDLTQQASVASQQAACTTAAATTTATTTNTTGHIYIPNGSHHQQIPLGSTTAGHLAHHNNPHQQPELNRVQGLDRVQAQQMPAQQRHFVTIAESSHREQRPPSIVPRPLSQGANCQQQAPPTSTTQAPPVAGKYASRLVEAYPVAPVREQLARPQLVMASQQHPGPQQSGLILMPGDRGLTTNDRPSSSNSMAAGGGPRIAQAERPAIILYEPPSSSPIRPIYNQLEQTKDSRSKTFKHSAMATYNSTSDPISRSDIVQAGTTTTGKTTNEQVASSNGPETCSTTTTTLGGLSCSPPRRSAIDRAEKPINSSDNLVSDHQSMDGKSLQENISSNNDKMKPKQKKTTKKAVQIAAPATTITTTTTIQDQGSQEVPVKKKSRGGRKKKQVTHDELMARKNRSKERNRVAARRCRQKRKQFLDELRDKIDHLHELNQSLRSENSMLKGELETIKRHHSACNI